MGVDNVEAELMVKVVGGTADWGLSQWAIGGFDNWVEVLLVLRAVTPNESHCL